jgi:hypothetical protein
MIEDLDSLIGSAYDVGELGKALVLFENQPSDLFILINDSLDVSFIN